MIEIDGGWCTKELSEACSAPKLPARHQIKYTTGTTWSPIKEKRREAPPNFHAFGLPTSQWLGIMWMKIQNRGQYPLLPQFQLEERKGKAYACVHGAVEIWWSPPHTVITKIHHQNNLCKKISSQAFSSSPKKNVYWRKGKERKGKRRIRHRIRRKQNACMNEWIHHPIQSSLSITPIMDYRYYYTYFLFHCEFQVVSV